MRDINSLAAKLTVGTIITCSALVLTQRRYDGVSEVISNYYAAFADAQIDMSRAGAQFIVEKWTLSPEPSPHLEIRVQRIVSDPLKPNSEIIIFKVFEDEAIPSVEPENIQIIGKAA